MRDPMLYQIRGRQHNSDEIKTRKRLRNGVCKEKRKGMNMYPFNEEICILNVLPGCKQNVRSLVRTGKTDRMIFLKKFYKIGEARFSKRKRGIKNYSRFQGFANPVGISV